MFAQPTDCAGAVGGRSGLLREAAVGQELSIDRVTRLRESGRRVVTRELPARQARSACANVRVGFPEMQRLAASGAPVRYELRDPHEYQPLRGTLFLSG